MEDGGHVIAAALSELAFAGIGGEGDSIADGTRKVSAHYLLS